MCFLEEFEEILKKEKIRKATLARHLNTSRQAINYMFQHKDYITESRMQELADAIDYKVEITLVPKK